MNKKDLAYVVILAGSVFSISILLFSKGITSVSVAIGNGDPVAIATPQMYPLNEVIMMLALSVIATNCFSKLTCIGDIKYELIKSLDNKYAKNEEINEKIHNINSQNDYISEMGNKTVDLDYFEEEPSYIEFEEDIKVEEINEIEKNSEHIILNNSVDENISNKKYMNYDNNVENQKIDILKNEEVKSKEINEEKKEKKEEKRFRISNEKLKNLKEDELKIYNLLYESENKELLQNKIVLETGLSKVKVSRTIRKLELYGIVVRKPYGNTNRISLKCYE
ncbi:helix-turn-helix transcriptional regulator [Methanococcus voltae]|uniref:Transcriptional regulator, TrmB n=1 Tax=Methanococcus voltae (strain ATCC BAA-1334 / A3) TaxID=456320 RepID=D7DQW0_METV3|nr:TrmB family transcriptional regulator [Methanococcus voltae]MCS3900897.1 putative membrane protein [Methanococcus voltae]